jgi:hypothetical protein
LQFVPEEEKPAASFFIPLAANFQSPPFYYQYSCPSLSAGKAGGNKQLATSVIKQINDSGNN